VDFPAAVLVRHAIYGIATPVCALVRNDVLIFFAKHQSTQAVTLVPMRGDELFTHAQRPHPNKNGLPPKAEVHFLISIITK
jgi:hypothetical protein